MSRARSMTPYMLVGLGVAGASYLSSKDNRNKMVGFMNSMKDRIRDFWCEHNPSACQDLLEKAAHPDPYDIADTRMVDEGAMYSIDYYNREEQQR